MSRLSEWWASRKARKATDAQAMEDFRFRHIKAYAAGQQAAREGKEFYENPHAGPCQEPRSFNKWLAGWCHVKATQEQSLKDRL